MSIKIIECPRDAMQGMHDFVPTKDKINYINALLKVGYHTLDCGSFVSPKYIPQMRDSAEVIDSIDASTSTKLSVIVANERGLADALKHDRIDYIGYPFSISEQFQQRNTKKSIEESVELVKRIHDKTVSKSKDTVIYISMGFGNPYDEEWSVDIVEHWVGTLADLGITSFSISDTVGVSTRDDINAVYNKLIASFPTCEFGAHFHTRPDQWREKVEAAHQNGCKRFDGAISGFGGCPMAKDELVGNMPTERLIEYFVEQKIETGIDLDAFEVSRKLANQIF